MDELRMLKEKVMGYKVEGSPAYPYDKGRIDGFIDLQKNVLEYIDYLIDKKRREESNEDIE